MPGKIAEMVEAEASEAEAADDTEPAEPEPTEPEPTEPEPEPEPEPAEQVSMEKALKAFERENNRHERELARIMGDDFAAFALCAGCAGVGFAPSSAIQFDPDLERCERCKGHGSMLTGSVSEMHVVRECVACQGQGFTVKVQQPSPMPPTAPPIPQYDPYTGQLIENGALGAAEPAPGPWAPGYSPPGTAAPMAVPGR